MVSLWNSASLLLGFEGPAGRLLKGNSRRERTAKRCWEAADQEVRGQRGDVLALLLPEGLRLCHLGFSENVLEFIFETRLFRHSWIGMNNKANGKALRHAGPAAAVRARTDTSIQDQGPVATNYLSCYTAYRFDSVPLTPQKMPGPVGSRAWCAKSQWALATAHEKQSGVTVGKHAIFCCPTVRQEWTEPLRRGNRGVHRWESGAPPFLRPF